jgi:translation initiation factor 1
MSRPNKNKIPTDAQNRADGMFQAFAGLHITGLPEAPAQSVRTDSDASVSIQGGAKLQKLGRVVLRRETAHRGGKCVVVVDGFDPKLDEVFIQALAKRLRAECGCGGAVKERSIELQGDQVPKIRALLAKEGFKVAGVS